MFFAIFMGDRDAKQRGTVGNAITFSEDLVLGGFRHRRQGADTRDPSARAWEVLGCDRKGDTAAWRRLFAEYRRNLQLCLQRCAVRLSRYGRARIYSAPLRSQSRSCGKSEIRRRQARRNQRYRLARVQNTYRKMRFRKGYFFDLFRPLRRFFDFFSSRRRQNYGSSRTCRVVIVDEREEIFTDELSGREIDVLSGYRRALGISLATRCLSPQVILTDEIAAEDSADILAAANAGVPIIATAHASSAAELMQREDIRGMLVGGVFRRLVGIYRVNGRFVCREEDFPEK